MIQDSELVDQMIESRTHIVNAIPNDKREISANWAKIAEGDENLVVPLSVRIEGDRLNLRFRAQSSIESRLDLSEIALRTPNFGAN
jgi:hypothetical protein